MSTTDTQPLNKSGRAHRILTRLLCRLGNHTSCPTSWTFTDGRDVFQPQCERGAA